LSASLSATTGSIAIAGPHRHAADNAKKSKTAAQTITVPSPSYTQEMTGIFVKLRRPQSAFGAKEEAEPEEKWLPLL
jgi:hypothetical protein